MASHVLCGNCGSALPHPSATCARCGASPAARAHAGWSPFAAYATGGYAAPAPGRKSPWLAALCALVPGMGHFYLGQPLKGGFYLLACGGLEFLGADLDLTGIGAALGIPLGVGGFGTYLFQIWDAYHQAKRLESQPDR